MVSGTAAGGLGAGMAAAAEDAKARWEAQEAGAQEEDSQSFEEAYHTFKSEWMRLRRKLPRVRIMLDTVEKAVAIGSFWAGFRNIEDLDGWCHSRAQALDSAAQISEPRGQDIKEPETPVIQEPRGQVIQEPRSKDVEEPMNQVIQEAKNQAVGESAQPDLRLQHPQPKSRAPEAPQAPQAPLATPAPPQTASLKTPSPPQGRPGAQDPSPDALPNPKAEMEMARLQEQLKEVEKRLQMQLATKMLASSPGAHSPASVGSPVARESSSSPRVSKKSTPLGMESPKGKTALLRSQSGSQSPFGRASSGNSSPRTVSDSRKKPPSRLMASNPAQKRKGSSESQDSPTSWKGFLFGTSNASVEKKKPQKPAPKNLVSQETRTSSGGGGKQPNTLTIPNSREFQFLHRAARRIQANFRGYRCRMRAEEAQVFGIWNQLELDDEADHHDQSIMATKVEANLRKLYKNGCDIPIQSSAVSMAMAAGISPVYSDWPRMFQMSSGYVGPHLEWPLTPENVKYVVDHIRRKPDQPIHPLYIAQILAKASESMQSHVPGAVHHMDIPDHPDAKMVICGDVHGQLEDVLYVTMMHGTPGPLNSYIFNGDVADRGNYAVECFVIILLHLILYPKRVMMNRGNHEDSTMNRRSQKSGGGFYDEVMKKYNNSIFLMFQQFFELLPLATVVSDKIFVTHAGIPRVRDITISQINAVDRRRQIPTTIETANDAVFFDAVWSDPHPELGFVPSPERGPGGVKFGKDVTAAFLVNNGLSMVVRGHELPPRQRGYIQYHDNHVVTLFTASNYCGNARNKGAVMLVGPRLDYKIVEHTAPTLARISAEYLRAKGKQLLKDESQDSRRAILDLENTEQHHMTHQQVQSMKADIIHKFQDKIVGNKDELWHFWQSADSGGSGTISQKQFRQGLAQSFTFELPMVFVQKMFLKDSFLDSQGRVLYNDLLEAYRPTANADTLNGTWVRDIVMKAYEALLNCDYTMDQTFSMLDTDGDGTVDLMEFKQALISSKLELPDSQINAIMRAIMRDSKTSLTVMNFLDGFQAVYSESKVQKILSPQLLQAQKNLTILSEKLFETRSRSEAFKEIDTDGDGYISIEEFWVVLDKMGFAHLMPPERQSMWDILNLNGDEHVNYLEFISAFRTKAEVSRSLDEVSKEVVASVLTILQGNKMSIDVAFRFFDPRGDGCIAAEDFKDGLRALNLSIGASGGALSEDQLQILVDYVDKDKDGTIDYSEFQSAFNLS